MTHVDAQRAALCWKQGCMPNLKKPRHLTCEPNPFRAKPDFKQHKPCSSKDHFSFAWMISLTIIIIFATAEQKAFALVCFAFLIDFVIAKITVSCCASLSCASFFLSLVRPKPEQLSPNDVLC